MGQQWLEPPAAAAAGLPQQLPPLLPHTCCMTASDPLRCPLMLQDKAGMIIPVEITVYEDRSFTFVLKTPPASGASRVLCSRGAR